MEIKSEEIWKDVVGYEGLYQISNFGRLKHLAFILTNICGVHNVKERLVHPHIQNNGYYLCDLYKNNIRKNVLLHRIVAEAFIDNPNNYSFVNHINSIRTDCRCVNLEWCTKSYNTKYSYDTTNRKIKMNWKKGKDNANSKAVIMLDKNNNYIKRFECIMDIQRELGILYNSIVNCLKGRSKTSGGYKWIYAE